MSITVALGTGTSAPTGTYAVLTGRAVCTVFAGTILSRPLSAMALRYQTGEEIREGDSVRFHGEPGRIELVAEKLGNVETDWYMQEYGGGVMILDKIAGRTFISADQLPDCEDLEFVSRA